ncbi:DNA binding domain-containing protein, excisionase family [Thermomonospora echinospora]|uniref:DNA binding domain-containing protein, excisionase family n=1 Tax=Thermomonospora echinospora TaxID=1992 RepID=A0A1H5YID9_9ACTN|nr:helix-turn-helix domain-containing protein [Thermomonospora echinospora]SEG23472.1 DNA binding domain-containing protein, excisionase family [Thermomonospora echinospora]
MKPQDDHSWQRAYLTPGQAAYLLRTTTGTVRRWARAGLIRHLDPGHLGVISHTRYLSEDVQALAELLNGHRRPTIHTIHRLQARRDS